MNLQELFNFLRNEKSMSDESIAERIKMHKTTIFRYRTGKNRHFRSRDDMAVIAKAFDMKLSYDAEGNPDFTQRNNQQAIENTEIAEPLAEYELSRQLEQTKRELAQAKKLLLEKDQQIARQAQTIKKIDTAIHEITTDCDGSLELDIIR